jgi:hypothetical protein
MQDLLKDVSAFTTINSDETIAISINSREFYKGVCDEFAGKLKIVLKYIPDIALFNKEFFMTKYHDARHRDDFFVALDNSYQGNFASDTLIIKL